MSLLHSLPHKGVAMNLGFDAKPHLNTPYSEHADFMLCLIGSHVYWSKGSTVCTINSG